MNTLESWYEINQRALRGALARVRTALKRLDDNNPDGMVSLPEAEVDPASALGRLCAAFRLTPFERDILILSAASEVESDFPKLIQRAQRDPAVDYPTFGLAMDAFPDASEVVLSPVHPLRYWGLIELEPGRGLLRCPIHINERILFYLMGYSYVDQRLSGIIQPLDVPASLAWSHQRLAEDIAGILGQAEAPIASIIQLTGIESPSKRQVAAAVAYLHNQSAACVSLSALPANAGDLETFIRVWQRESVLGSQLLMVDAESIDFTDHATLNLLNRLVERLGQPVLLAVRDRVGLRSRASLAFELSKPTRAEQVEAWQATLPDLQAEGAWLEQLTSQFDLNLPDIQAVSAAAVTRTINQETLVEPQGSLQDRVWQLCRLQSRPRLDALAQRIQPSAGWDDLVIPETQRQLLQEIVLQVRQRARVYDTWEFRSKGSRGLGISALFAGISGAGKTMAAEVMASELQLDLYRIDLSGVMSKYIGETERNLRQVFDAAEGSGVILLFDEADALFGKRSEVKDSHDRYANVEISYLLQRMEAYRGLAILTTNLKDNLDPAFLRRIHFVVNFPFPDLAQRAQIWQGIFPEATPTSGLESARLAQLNLAGGNIRNIALNAAFQAAGEGEAVSMAHILKAARLEYLKIEKPLTAAETRGWDESEH